MDEPRDLGASETGDALRRAVAAKSELFQRYSYFSLLAKESGLEQAADILMATARNEAEVARHGLSYLFERVDPVQFLEVATARDQSREFESYARLEELARTEGFDEVADYFRDAGVAEDKHQNLLSLLRDALRHGQTLEGRTVAYSAMDMAQIMLPDQANVAGYVHGGELMKVMDNAAWVVACRHARRNTVTANVEEMNFHSRVRVGGLVLMHARITFVARTSMEVRVDVEAEDLLSGRRIQALTAYFTTVALDAEGNPTRVPPLIISTREEQRLYEEGKARYEAKRRVRQVREPRGKHS
jgi:acyl-CoA hydrolase